PRHEALSLLRLRQGPEAGTGQLPVEVPARRSDRTVGAGAGWADRSRYSRRRAGPAVAEAVVGNAAGTGEGTTAAAAGATGRLRWRPRQTGHYVSARSTGKLDRRNHYQPFGGMT